MNDDLTNLDRRAGRAADGLHRAAASRPVRPFDPTAIPGPAPHNGQSRSRRYLAAAAAVAVLAGGAVGIAAVTRDDGKSDVTGTQIEPARPYVAGWLPDGLEPFGFGSFDGRTGEGGAELLGSFHVFGEHGSVEVGIGSGPSIDDFAEDDSTGSSRRTRVEVDGRTVWHVATPFASAGDTWSVVPAGDRSVVVVAPSLSDEERDRIAARSVVDDELVVPSEVSERWTAMGVIDDPLAMSPYAAGVGTGSPVHQATYGTVPSAGSSSIGDRSVSITSRSTTDDPTIAVQLLVPDARPIDVRGRSGTAGSIDVEGVGTQKLVVWTERPGEVVAVFGLGITDEEMIRIAEDVRPADPDQWRADERDSRLGRWSDAINHPGADVVELGSGELPDGSAWRLAYVVPGPETPPDGPYDTEPTVEVRLHVEGENSTNSSSWDGEAPFRETARTTSGSVSVAGGLVDPEVASVRVETVSGDVLAEHPVLVAEGHSGWTSEVGPAGTVVVALAEDGAELGRLPLGSADVACTDQGDCSSGFQGGTVETTAPTGNDN